MAIATGLGVSSADQPGDAACIKRVTPGELNDAWPQVVEWMLQQPDYWARYYDPQDIYLMLFCEPERYQLWLVGEWMAPFGCFITEIRTFPKCKMLVFILALAEPDGQPKLGAGDFYHETIVSWAKDQGVKFSRIEGRKGWERIGKSLGYDEVRVTLTMSLEKVWRQ